MRGAAVLGVYSGRLSPEERKRYGQLVKVDEEGKIFEEQVMAWFREEDAKDGSMPDGFCEAFARGDAETGDRNISGP